MGIKRGRRPASEGTRNQILDAARVEFAERGYDGTSLRGIARRCGVDPALLHHYFDGKAGLFAEVVAVPADIASIVKGIVDGPADQLGARVAGTFLRVWDAPQGRDRFVALVRSAVSNEQAASALREFVTKELLGKVAVTLRLPDADLRASLAASQMIGLAVLRYVVRLEPLAAATPQQLIALVGPTLQRYLTP